MESLLARALESKLKYWLKSFRREQFKLQGRSVQLHNLDVDGDVLHSTLGLPPLLAVTQARIGKLELQLPYISNVKVEPIVVDIDKLDLVLAERMDHEQRETAPGSQASTSGRSTSYGFADQIADGMTIQVGVVNLMVETRGGSRDGGSAAWTPPLASITMRGLTLRTTNQNWEVVNLKEARNFSADKKCVYVFKKLEWESISVDLLPHPDMFVDERLLRASFEGSRRDSDGARRLFFGGERFLDNISGTAFITMHRTEQNNPIGLEVQLVLPEVTCPAFSEPGLRALLRFMTGFYVCLNRGDIEHVPQTGDSPVCTLVSVKIEHIFLRTSDADFRLELLAQALKYQRASIPEGNRMRTLGSLILGGLFLRDTFSQPACALVQPSMVKASDYVFPVPTFAGEKMWPVIYPLASQKDVKSEALVSIYSSQLIPSPAPPTVASQTVIQCQPLKICLQEKSCLQIASFLADGIMLESGVVLPDTSLNATYFSLRQLDLSIPLNHSDHLARGSFTGARLHIEDLMFAESPNLTYRLLKLDDDPACFPLWRGQPVDSSQKRSLLRANRVTVSLETTNSTEASEDIGLWHCIEMEEPSLESAMVTADGLPLLKVPPPAGVVRLGISWTRFISNASVEQLLFVLDMYSYLAQFSKALLKVNSKTKSVQLNRSKSLGEFVEDVPADSAITLGLGNMEINFLDSFSSRCTVEGPALVKLAGTGIHFEVSHKSLGGAIAVSSTVQWQSVRVECVDTEEETLAAGMKQVQNMRAIFWVEAGSWPFLDIKATHMMPYKAEDSEFHSLKVAAKVSGVRLGGGMIYAESLLHRFGIFGPDGGPGKEFTKIMKSVPLAHLFEPMSATEDTGAEQSWEIKTPANVQLDMHLQDWLFALEGVERVAETQREKACWHSTFQSLRICTEKNKDKKPQKILLLVEELQTVKPVLRELNGYCGPPIATKKNGLCLEVHLVEKQEEDLGLGEWTVEKLHASVKQPLEMETTKNELEHVVQIAKAEVEAASRIAVGILQVLKLQESVGQAAIQQLSSLGSGSLDKFVMTPERSRRASFSSINSGTPTSTLKPRDSGISEELQVSVSKSLQLCEKLQLELESTQGSRTSNLLLLAQQLNQMQDLVLRLPQL